MRLHLHELPREGGAVAELLRVDGIIEVYEGEAQVAVLVAPARFEHLVLCEDAVEMEFEIQPSIKDSVNETLTYQEVLARIS